MRTSYDAYVISCNYVQVFFRRLGLHVHTLKLFTMSQLSRDVGETMVSFVDLLIRGVAVLEKNCSSHFTILPYKLKKKARDYFRDGAKERERHPNMLNH